MPRDISHVDCVHGGRLVAVVLGGGSRRFRGVWLVGSGSLVGQLGSSHRGILTEINVFIVGGR